VGCLVITADVEDHVVQLDRFGSNLLLVRAVLRTGHAGLEQEDSVLLEVARDILKAADLVVLSEQVVERC
jgi:hypothetical protein